MILGIGTDLVDERRVDSLMDRFRARFLDRVYTPREQGDAEKRKSSSAQSRAYASRFAAKEACAKALGTGFRGGVSWQNIEIIRGDMGKPSLNLSGPAYDRLVHMTPSGYSPQVHLSMTDEPPYCQAFVVISAEKSIP